MVCDVLKKVNVRARFQDGYSGQVCVRGTSPLKLATSSAEQVTKIKAILNSLGLETASPAEARAALGLKGRANVRF